MTLHVALETRGPGAKVLAADDYEVDPDNPLTFGRAAEQNRLHLPDDKKMVSSRHGRIEKRADGYYVVDLQSTNGTTLDGAPVPAGAGLPLRDGACIVVGGFTLRVALQARARARPEFESTLLSFDPEQIAGAAWEALCRRQQQRRGVAATERRAELREELLRHVRRLPPPQQRAVLKRVLARAGAGDEKATGGTAEELLAAGLAELQRLAQALVAGRALANARDATRFAQLVQGFFDLTLRWVVQCMQARAEFEQQFGAEVTMVFQRSSNPLKGLAAEELGKSLLDWAGDRDVEAVRNQLEGIYRDLTQHQLGLLVGVKEAITAVMERLSPEAIETIAQKDAGWLTSKGAKAWEVYRQIYREFLEEKSKLFHDVISPAIRRGYLGSHHDSSGAKPD